jgi:RNA polymerase-binding transcription factor
MSENFKRNADLRRILSTRQNEMQHEVQRGIRHGRAERSDEVGDSVDRADANSQRDIDFALLQMRTQTLTRIDEALVRLDMGTYGSCYECQSEIADRRLRVLPFAVRCQACEGRREQAQGVARRVAQRRAVSVFADAVSF